MEEDGSYFVWVPRYAYKITPKTYSEKAGIIDVKFINGTGNTAYDGTKCAIATSNPDKTPNNIDSTSQYIVHPAFCTDVNMGGYNQELEGIWVAKYEASRESNTGGTSTTGIRAVSKPNVQSWSNVTIGNWYTQAYNYNRSIDSHLIKNSEWRSSSLFNP